MLDILKSLVDERTLITLAVLLSLSHEIRSYLKLYLDHKVEVKKLESR